nr:hypothetical protein [Deltaproteobacteria bacterium]
MTFASIGVFVAILRAPSRCSSLARTAAWHRLVEGRAVIFSRLTALAVFVGGVAELIPRW